MVGRAIKVGVYLAGHPSMFLQGKKTTLLVDGALLPLFVGKVDDLGGFGKARVASDAGFTCCGALGGRQSQSPSGGVGAGRCRASLVIERVSSRCFRSISGLSGCSGRDYRHL